MRADSFAKKVNSWEVLINNVKPHLPEMPYLQSFHDELETLLAAAKLLGSQQEDARAQLRDLTFQRQEMEKKGDRLWSRAAAHLRANFGFTSEQLVRFGLNPRPRAEKLRRRKKKAEEPTAETAEA